MEGLQEKLDLRRESAGVIVRAYNNAFVGDKVQTLLEMGLGKVVIATNSLEDDGQVFNEISARFSGNSQVEVIDLAANYSWSVALNQSISIIRQDESLKYVIPMSVEANFSERDIDAMLTAVSEPGVAVVGTTFKGVQDDGKEVSLGVSYMQPRNTGLALNITRLNEGILFDHINDLRGGMEDFDFLIRTRLAGLRVVMLNLEVPLAIGRYYNQEEKELREKNAMISIIQQWRSQTSGNPELQNKLDAAMWTLIEHWGISENDLARPQLNVIDSAMVDPSWLQVEGNDLVIDKNSAPEYVLNAYRD
jgi:hypothetical protein